MYSGSERTWVRGSTAGGSSKRHTVPWPVAMRYRITSYPLRRILPESDSRDHKRRRRPLVSKS